MNDADRKELLRLLELDYTRTASVLDGIVNSSTTIRGVSITVVLAVLGVAYTARLWELAALGVGVAVIFAVVDGYHIWLASEAREHAQQVERVTAAHYNGVARGDTDQDARIDGEAALQGHTFGVYSTMRRFRLRDVWNARPTVFVRGLYVAMAAGSALSAFLIHFAVR